jgi:hypothetical protein
MSPLPRCALVLCLSAVLLGCPSPQGICKNGVDQVCERVFECQTEQVKASASFQAAFGTGVDECKDLLYENPLRPQQAQGIACDAIDNDQKLCSNLGRPDATDFDLSEASECFDRREDLSCEAYLAQLNDPSQAPDACARRCN